MIINAEFKWNGQDIHLTCDEDKLDRNYDDEETAYFIQFLVVGADSGRFFEVNIERNMDTGELTEKGYVTYYLSLDDSRPHKIINNVKIYFT